MDDLNLFGKNEKQLDNLLNRVRIISEEIELGFGVSNCRVLIVMKGTLIHSEGIGIPSGDKIKE